MAQHPRVSRIEGRGAHQVIRSLRRSADSFEETSRVKGKFKRMRIEVAGLSAVCYSAIELPGCGKRAARVTTSRGPVRPDRQELLVGCCRFFVFPAIAEYPGTQISDFFFFGLQIEGTAGALDCYIAAALVVERLAQLTIDPGALLIGDIPMPEVEPACIEVAHRSRADHRLTNFTKVAQLRGTLGALKGRLSRSGRWPLAALGRISALTASPRNHRPPPD